MSQKKKKIYVLDTSVILFSHDSIMNFEENDIGIPITVLEELDHIKKGGHYVYFKSDFEIASFLTTNNFETQFGREVVYHNELILNSEFKTKVKKLEDKNQNLHIWRWQHYTFEEDIVKSMKTAKTGLTKLQNKYQKNFNEIELKIN